MAQIIYIALTVVGLLVAANQHGKPRDGYHSFWVVSFATALTLSLLYWGGFFNFGG